MQTAAGSPLEQVSFKLGSLDANVAILLQREEKRDAELKAQTAALEEIKATLKPLVDDVKFMKPEVRHYAGIRKRVTWVGSLLFTVGGTIGGAVGNYLIKKYGA